MVSTSSNISLVSPPAGLMSFISQGAMAKDAKELFVAMETLAVNRSSGPVPHSSRFQLTLSVQFEQRTRSRCLFLSFARRLGMHSP